MTQVNAELLDSIVEVARRGGEAALEHYGGDLGIETKGDDSPVTRADHAAHRAIVEALGRVTPEIPILSEESAEEEGRDRKSWPRFWLVDPLDGTKEFIKQTGQFTVNIALVDRNEVVLGVVHVPVTGVTYGGAASPDFRCAWVQDNDGERRAIQTRPADLEGLTVVASRDHAGPVVAAFLQTLENADVTSMGSSLKFCLVAEGKADFYPRVVPTMEWDTAAAQCVVEAAGGRVTDLQGRRMTYNKDDLRNPSVMSFGDPQVDWAQLFAERTRHLEST